jgi:hypothetical protein
MALSLFLGHDVEKEYIRQALGSVYCVVMHNPKPWNSSTM